MVGWSNSNSARWLVSGVSSGIEPTGHRVDLRPSPCVKFDQGDLPGIRIDSHSVRRLRTIRQSNRASTGNRYGLVLLTRGLNFEAKGVPAAEGVVRDRGEWQELSGSGMRLRLSVNK